MGGVDYIKFLFGINMLMFFFELVFFDYLF